ncbi:MAG TPA: FAD-dependent oxidoreductase, partial [Rhodocyclaceae bacterium]|nr:FAD-dependent oxidoreductase [Rhodocyclaceae bacterium]
DRIALGAYPADVHPLVTCSIPEFVRKAHDTLPFYIPFRALTNAKVENMLVAGKTMAQTFLVNSATREQPTEWSTGTAAGASDARYAGADAQRRYDIAYQQCMYAKGNQLPGAYGYGSYRPASPYGTPPPAYPSGQPGYSIPPPNYPPPPPLRRE